MKISREWDKRIEIWLSELQQDLHHVIAAVECRGFTTKEMLTPQAALQHDFQPMPPGTLWGGKWEYGWFRTEITLPPQAEGHRIIFSPDVGGEMLIWVNGQLAGSRDLEHKYITLTRCAKAGEQFEILIESYAGHGPRLENGGPYPPGRIPVPEPPPSQCRVGAAVVAIWNEPAYQLTLDVYTLNKLRLSLDAKSLRAQKVAEGLKRFTQIVDFEQPAEQRIAGYLQAREMLAPLLAAVNGTTAPLFTVFGQSHLDLAWKWPFAETKRKSARTLSSQLALMDEYPEYRFFLCQAPILESIKEHYPDVYDRIKAKIANGQIIPEGGLYIESDANIPGGESLIRQFIFGKRWYEEECGTESVMAWLPDTFGFTAALPQIMAGCGIRYFATQKLLRCPPESDMFPYNIFMWEGHDGTAILSHMLKRNNSGIDPQLLIQRWEEDRIQQENIDTFMFPFGYGDGGGGPTRDIYELATRVQDLEGAPRTRLESPIDFFRAIERGGLPQERYVGELYLPWHRGTYTSLAKLKKGNRRAEAAMRETELWAAFASAKSGSGAESGILYPHASLNALWKKLLFNQFHDILAGTSITRVNEEAEQDYALIQAETDELLHQATRALMKQESKDTVQEDKTGLVLFNSLSWRRRVQIPLPEGMAGAVDGDGRELPAQGLEGRIYVEVELPSCGYRTIYPYEGPPADEAQSERSTCHAYLENGGAVLENECLHVVFNPFGQISEIVDKATGMQYADGLCNEFRMYKDVNMEYDAWEIGSMYASMPVPLEEPAELDIVSSGGRLFAAIGVTRKLNNSLVKQVIWLEQGSRRVDFKTEVDWQEQHKLLKVNFPVRVRAEEALHEIQFGYVKRPTHRSRRYDADRYEVWHHKYVALAEAGHGFAVLNDCKYGSSVEGGSINLTLLKAPVIPDMYADQGHHSFTYSFYAYRGSFADSGTAHSGYELNYPVYVQQGSMPEQSLFSIVMDHREMNRNLHDFQYGNIIIETIKQADDQSGDLIIRMYESQNTATRCILQSYNPIAEAYQTDMRETALTALSVHDQGIPLEFRPFEIKTVRASLK